MNYGSSGYVPYWCEDDEKFIKESKEALKYKWKVVPLCKEQLLDIDPNDVLPGGVFRTCDVYKSGGGYDKFPAICEKRLGIKTFPKQFVAQLYGCHLKCPYCYVTPKGIWNKPVEYTTDELLLEFFESGCNVLHLMGGSPALYIEHWSDIIDNLSIKYVFHSDLLLTEKKYDAKVLKAISMPNCLYAVNIKGTTYEDYRKNTGCELDGELFWDNFAALVVNKVPFYITLTNPDMDYYRELRGQIFLHFGQKVLEDMFIIDLIEYDAVGAYNDKAV